ncbi:MAG: hypothetical protein HC867_08000 [Bacteroidia bacterium]|nr:hypothetical protein [Bacteroidia bacterium]
MEYKDREGKVILKKVQLDATITDNYTGWLCTYYIYDDFNQLRYVLQPQAVKLLLDAGTWDISITNLKDELCFRYEYDYRNRMILKKSARSRRSLYGLRQPRQAGVYPGCQHANRQPLAGFIL